MTVAHAQPSSVAEPDGSVVAVLTTGVPAARVWQALTEPATVAQWFGKLSDQLRPGGTARLDFGDGDFFDITDIRLESPRHLRYAWRFMGTGPVDTIDWTVRPAGGAGGGATVVTVTDSEDGRTPEAAQVLKDGWLDFTGRLARFLETGEPTRYDWRRELDAAIELPGARDAAWTALFSLPGQSRWLPVTSLGLRPGGELTVGDGSETIRLEIAEVVWEPPERTRFQLGSRDWAGPTLCELRLTWTPVGGTLLSVSHVGWEAISPDPTAQLRARRRLSRFWTAALERARRVVETASEPSAPA
jgi:uncharacterized protein YndB with AHSA1/START domain